MKSVFNSGFRQSSFLDWGARRLAPDAEVFSDGLGCSRCVIDLDHAHTVLTTDSGRYHALKQSKYARRYLAEAAYRFNRRVRLCEMLPRPLRAMVGCAPCSEPAPRAVSNFRG